MAFSKTVAMEFLRRAYEQERLAHAYLFSGPSGSGKRELVMQLAALVNGLQPNGTDILKHPDVHIAEPESKSRRIVIDQVRGLEKGLQMRSTLGGKKVGILFEADRLKVEASNAFLKTLEEPPDNSLLLLTTTQPEVLPDTIISRCVCVSLSGVARQDPTESGLKLLNTLREFFSREVSGVAPAFGLVREFVQLLQETRQKIQGELDDAQESEEARYKQTTDGEWLKDREDHFKALAESRYVQERFRLVAVLLNWWADVLRHQNHTNELEYPAFSDCTARIAGRITMPQTLRNIACIGDLRENLDRNVQELLAIEAAFVKMFCLDRPVDLDQARTS